jgi:hypothetical protein
MSEHGALSDIAPSMLHLMNMDIPPEMTGTPLVDLALNDTDNPEPTPTTAVTG